jgi:hypothetical protein
VCLGQVDGLVALNDLDIDDDFNTDDVDLRRSWGLIWLWAESSVFISNELLSSRGRGAYLVGS